MARQEKNTRIRGIPPREQLKEYDSMSGSFPTVLRFSSDGRNGNGPTRFDDRRTVVYGQAVTTHFPAIGLSSGSLYLTLSGAGDLPLTTTIITTGSNKASNVDELFFVAQKETQRLSPFKETNLFEVDAKGLLTQSNFFATGSSLLEVGEGFTSPLWSKQKIEIDISVGSQTTLNLKRANVYGTAATGSSFPMAYYNFSTQAWEPVGLGYEINAFTDPWETVEHLMIGFGNGFLPPGNSIPKLKSAGYCISDLGFPYHPKFHATSSQTLSMRNYISEPFVLEKAVITISGSWSIGTVSAVAYNQASRRTVTSSINSCFILNQRRNQNFYTHKKLVDIGEPLYYTEITATVPCTRKLSTGASVPDTRVDTIRDLVGFSQVFSFAASTYDKTVTDATYGDTTPGQEMTITSNDVIITNNSSNSGTTGADWTGLVRMSMSMCTPSSGFHSNNAGSHVSGAFMTTVLKFDTVTDYDEIALGHGGYRTGLGIAYPSTRGLVGDYYRNPNRKTVAVPGTYQTAYLEITEDKHRVNPYILLPEDNLILGWQIPFSANPAQLITANQNESTFTFLTGSFKMVLYGSYMRDGKEWVETLNQLLTTPAIHETIG